MRRLIVLTEVYSPENFNINPLVEEFADSYSITVVTRCPSYPSGRLYPGYKNRFTIENKGKIRIIRYPIFLDYDRFKLCKLANLLWQPFATFFILLLLKWDKLFVYQTGSLYTYTFLPLFPKRNRRHVIWSQDLWPEVGFEYGFPRVHILERALKVATKIILRSFCQVIVQSPSFQRHYKESYGLDSSVIYNFVSINKRNNYKNRNKFNSLVYAGNIGSLQNVDQLIQLFLKLKSAFPDIKTLEIFGDGSLFEEMKGLYSNLGGITFHGRVPQRMVQEALNHCRFGIFSLVSGPIQMTIPSRLQFLHNCNVPIIYLGSGATAEFIKKQRSGVVIESLSTPDERVAELIREFESIPFVTKDIFSKQHIIAQLHDTLR